MTREQRDAWVAALRSGKFQQGAGRLRSSVGYCCLGVAAEVVLECEWVPLLGAFRAKVEGHPLMSSDLDPLANGPDLLGLSDAQQERLMTMNDNGYSFAEIADWIEAHVPVEEAAS